MSATSMRSPLRLCDLIGRWWLTMTSPNSPRFFGLLGSRRAQIGHLDSKATALMSKLGPDDEIRAVVKSVYAPEQKDNPRVTLLID